MLYNKYWQIESKKSLAYTYTHMIAKSSATTELKKFRDLETSIELNILPSLGARCIYTHIYI